MHVTRFPILVVTVLLMLPAASAFANDSSAEFAAGGLVLKKSDSIALLSEDLFISAKQVRVKYVFQNTTAKDVTTEVAFPLPELPEPGEREFNLPNRESDNFVNFVTKIDGVAVPLKVELKALTGKLNLTDELEKLGVPLNPRNPKCSAAVKALPEAMRKRLRADGLISEEDDGSVECVWAMQATFHRAQTFPAGRTITVEHTYTPVVGGYAGATLAEAKKNDTERRAMVDKYCVDSVLEHAITRAKQKNPEAMIFSETTIGYVLKTGANWAGPIRDFRLVVDKGSPTNLLSLCATGLRKISPTQFEVRKTNFMPTSDLAILILSSANE